MQQADVEKKQAIFVVEDEALVAYDVQQRLEAAGHTVSGVATSGEEALRLLPGSESSLVLMDVSLGKGIDGIEVVNRLRPHSDLPVIYLTAYSEREIVERAKATEPFGYIVKPLTSFNLEITVALAFQRCALQRKLLARGPNEQKSFSATREEGLLKSLEVLMCSPGFLDLELGYDHKCREFYAGCLSGKSLNELIGTILLHQSARLSSHVN